MHDRLLEVFLKVAERGSFSGAAEDLYITPSAVSQRISQLEGRLGAVLFERSHHGVKVTEAGACLVAEAENYIRWGNQIREQLQFLDTRRHAICVGTGRREKPQFLYDFWTAYMESGGQYDIRLVSLKNRNPTVRGADMVESIRNGAPWQAGWEFFRICDMPVGMGIDRHHALASGSVLHLDDLAGWTVWHLGTLETEEMQSLCQALSVRKIPIKRTEEYDFDLFWKSAVSLYALLMPLCWQDVMPDMRILPLETDATLPYGFFYRPDASAPVREFLDFVVQRCRDMPQGPTGRA